MLKIKQIAFLLLLFANLPAFTQKLVDKLNIYGGFGLAILPGKENTDVAYLPRNAFGNFKPALSFNICLLYHKNERLSLGLDSKYFAATKPNHTLRYIGVGPIVKFNFSNTFNKVSPFAILGPRFGYIHLNRGEYKISEKPAPPSDPAQVDIQQVNLHFGYSTFGITSIGAMCGLGVDFQVNKRLKVYVMAGYTLQFTNRNMLLKENYPQHSANLSLLSADIGINYRLRKHDKHQKNINNIANQESEHRRQETMKKIANASAKKHVTQKMPAHQTPTQEQGEKIKLRTLPKETLDPNKRYTVNGQIEGTEGRKVDDVSILVQDESGHTVGTAKPDKHGHFAYKGLKPDNYTIALNKQDPRLKATAEITAEDPELKIEAASMNQFHYNRLASNGKHNGIVLGDAKLTDKNLPAEDQTMLLLDKSGQVIASTQTNKEGKYAFRNLKSDEYQVVPFENPNITAKAVAAGGDPLLKIDEATFEKFSFKKLNNGQQPEPVITGKINPASQSSKGTYDPTILLLDKMGNVVAQTTANQQGRFAFKGLKPDDYQAVLAAGNPTVAAKVSLSTTDPSLQMPQDAFFKFGHIGNSGTPEKFITGKITLSTHQHATEDATVLLVDDNGNVVESTKLTKEGNFVFKNVRAATYQVVVEGADYEKAIFEVSKNDASNSTLSTSAFKTVSTSTASNNSNLVVGKIDMGPSNLPEAGTGVLLVDQQGVPVERTTSDKEGHFVFKNVQAANYQVIVEGQDYQKVTMNVANSDKSEKIPASAFTKHHFAKISPDAQDNNMLIGHVVSSSPKSVEDKTVLLLDEKGIVVGKTITRKDGSFTFNGLKSEGYQTVLEKPDPTIKTKLSAMVKDPDMKISMSDVYKYNPDTKQMEKLTETDHVIVTGTIRSEDYTGVENRTVILVDDQGNTVKEVISDKSGIFKFNGIKAKDYQVIYQDGDKKVHPVVQIYKDNDPAITEQGGKIAQTLFYGTNEYKLTDADKQALHKFVNYYKEHPSLKLIKLNAYGDASGTDQVNMEITQKRAQLVLDYLQKEGIPISKLKLNPLGKSLKFKNKYNHPDPKLNRKVDIEIVEQ